MVLFRLSDGKHKRKQSQNRPLRFLALFVVSLKLIGVCRTPILSIRSFYANPKFGNFRKDVTKNDVAYIETGVCRQHYSMNNPLILYLFFQNGTTLICVPFEPFILPVGPVDWLNWPYPVSMPYHMCTVVVGPRTPGAFGGALSGLHQHPAHRKWVRHA